MKSRDKTKRKTRKHSESYENILGNDKKFLKSCSKATITEDSEMNEDIGAKLKIDEFMDVYCVAKNKKPLAALDFSTSGINKFRKGNKKLVNKVIDYCNYKGIQALHNKQKGGMYLKTIFFLPKNYKEALKLMGILWYDNLTTDQSECQFMIGKLLGYSDKDIKFFIKRNYNKNITSSDIKKFKKNLKKLNITLEGLQGSYDIVHLKTIEKI